MASWDLAARMQQRFHDRCRESLARKHCRVPWIIGPRNEDNMDVLGYKWELGKTDCQLRKQTLAKVDRGTIKRERFLRKVATKDPKGRRANDIAGLD